jgi:hypothetical protein
VKTPTRSFLRIVSTLFTASHCSLLAFSLIQAKTKRRRRRNTAVVCTIISIPSPLADDDHSPAFLVFCCLHLVPKHFVSRPSCVGLSLSPSLESTNLVSTQIKIATPRVSSFGPSSTSSNLSQTHVLMPQRFSLSSPTKYGSIFFTNKPCESARCTPSNLLLFSPL